MPCAAVEIYRASGVCYLLSNTSGGVQNNDNVDTAARPGCSLDPDACLQSSCDDPSVTGSLNGVTYVYNRIERGCGETAKNFATVTSQFFAASVADCQAIQMCADWARTDGDLVFQVYYSQTDSVWHCDLQAAWFAGTYAPNTVVLQYYQYSIKMNGRGSGRACEEVL